VPIDMLLCMFSNIAAFGTGDSFFPGASSALNRKFVFDCGNPEWNSGATIASAPWEVVRFWQFVGFLVTLIVDIAVIMNW